jgi:hypothetical protein
MKKSELEQKKKCKIVSTVSDVNGALYESDIVEILDWTEISTNTDEKSIVVHVKDFFDKRHTVGLNNLITLDV